MADVSDRWESEILRLAALLRDENQAAAVGSRVLLAQIQRIVAGRPGGEGKDWTETWKDSGTWGRDTWTNNWTGEKASTTSLGERPVELTRDLERARRAEPPELRFTAEEIQVLRELNIID